MNVGALGALTGNWRQVVTLLLLCVVPLGTAVVFIWDLHTPQPRVRTPVVINRNSLLPHRFAGPCMNCHRIQDVGPITMNRGNMNLFRLSPQEVRLLVAGQQVQAPSLIQQLRTPAITRSDPLPHRFVGVCSNCHVVLDVRPSQAFMQKSMQRAYQPLASMGLGAETIRRGGTMESHRRELWRNVWGFVALVLFMGSTVYVGMRFLIQSDKKRWGKAFKLKKWFTLHEWCASTFTVAAILHWYYSDRGNNFLHVALLAAIWLTAAGYVLRYRMAHPNTRKPVKLVHSQRMIFIALVLLLVVGHFFVEFH